MMNMYFKCIFFLWIICYTRVTDENDITVKNEITDEAGEKIPECPAGKFNVTLLGHSKLLITWKPLESDPIGSTFPFKPDGNNVWEQDIPDVIFEDGWYKMKTSLEENTLYQIKITQGGDSHGDCFLQTKTNPKTNSFPTKPDFKVTMMNEINRSFYGDVSTMPRVRIEWLPCGENKFCKADEIAGLDFSIKYKMLYYKQEWSTNVEKDVPYKYIYGLLPGREYEVVVTSIYGDFKTDSDPQLISIPAFCSPVRSVKIISLSNSSVFISWESPKHCQLQTEDDGIGYSVFYHVSNQNPVVFLNYPGYDKPYQEYSTSIYSPSYVNRLSAKWRTKILNTSIGTPYTFFIIPHSNENFHYGFEYRMDYTPKAYKADLPLAKPEFEYFKDSRELHIVWLPCGQTHDCKNKKPGSYFVVKYREETGKIQEKMEKTSERVSIRIFRDKKYEVWVESVDQSDRVKSDSVIIDTHEHKVNSK